MPIAESSRQLLCSQIFISRKAPSNCQRHELGLSSRAASGVGTASLGGSAVGCAPLLENSANKVCRGSRLSAHRVNAVSSRVQGGQHAQATSCFDRCRNRSTRFRRRSTDLVQSDAGGCTSGFRAARISGRCQLAQAIPHHARSRHRKAADVDPRRDRRHLHRLAGQSLDR